MNTRIKELADQAKDEVPKGILSPDLWIEQYNQKFAELIVRECLAQIDTVRDGCDEDGDHQQALGADWAGLAVARHFGVETVDDTLRMRSTYFGNDV